MGLESLNGACHIKKKIPPGEINPWWLLDLSGALLSLRNGTFPNFFPNSKRPRNMQLLHRALPYGRAAPSWLAPLTKHNFWETLKNERKQKTQKFQSIQPRSRIQETSCEHVCGVSEDDVPRSLVLRVHWTEREAVFNSVFLIYARLLSPAPCCPHRASGSI